MLTRIQYQNNQFVFHNLFILADSTFIGFGTAILKIYDDPPAWTIAWCMLLLTVTIFFIVFTRRKYPVELTDEERQRPVPARADYSNSLNWKHVLLFNLNIAYALIVMGFLPLYAKYIIAGNFAGIWVHLHGLLDALPVAWWVLVLICFMLPTCILFRRAGNRYILEGDTLIVSERNMFRREEELRIPVASISKVYIMGFRSTVQFLFIEVDGVTRQLFANTHVRELAVGILRRRSMCLNSE